MKRIVLNVDIVATAAITGVMYPVTRFVARSEKIVGLTERVDGYVQVSIKVSEDAIPVQVIVANSFEEVAAFMID